MRLFSGLDRTDYQDVLRAIGALIDRRRVADFRLLELEDGLLLQTWHFVLQPVKVELQRFTDAQLREVLAAAYQRRGSGGPRRAGRFEETLRAIGRLLDNRGWRDFRLATQEEGLILQATPSSARAFETYLLTPDEIEALRREAAAQRGTGRLTPPAAGPPAAAPGARRPEEPRE
jgi:hypothetical protein